MILYEQNLRTTVELLLFVLDVGRYDHASVDIKKDKKNKQTKEAKQKLGFDLSMGLSS